MMEEQCDVFGTKSSVQRNKRSGMTAVQETTLNNPGGCKVYEAGEVTLHSIS
jgi:hypothetical protein